jgi:dTDP-4-amino-4,6-dideoxygalactose transaminase
MIMRKDYLVFGSPAIGQLEIDEVVDSMKSGWLSTGPKVSKFEEMFKAYKGSKHGVALNSCSAALHLSMLVSNLKHGDQVITTAMTFCSTINSIIHAGATPVIVDIDEVTLNIDPEAIRSAITEKTKAILVVHFAGRPCEMDTICEIANENNLLLIEDCAHAIESEYKGRHAGTFGDFGCFSFYVTKNVSTGEGGMIITENEKYAARIKTLGLHGMSKDAWKRFSDEGYKHYYVTEAGFKYNMMDLQAAMGIHQLAKIENSWERRREVWDKYNEAFSDMPFTIPAKVDDNTRHAFHLYTIRINQEVTGISRDSFLAAMNDNNIGTGVHYLSIPDHPYYQKQYGWVSQDYPNAMKYGQETVSLPLSAKLSNYDVDSVIESIKKIIVSQ